MWEKGILEHLSVGGRCLTCPMTATANPPLDRVSDAVLHARADLDSLSETPVWPLTARATTDALDAVLALEAQVAELEGLLSPANADRLKTGEESGATSTANWWAHHTKLHPPRSPPPDAARPRPRDLRTPPGSPWPKDYFDVDQALVIAKALDDLPEDLDPALVEEAETHLIAKPPISTPKPSASWRGTCSRCCPE